MRLFSKLLLAAFISACAFSKPLAAQTTKSVDERRELQTHEVQLMSHPGESLAQLLDTIRSAKSSIDAEYFIHYPCWNVGRLFWNAIFAQIERAKAAGRPLRVRFLIDGITFREVLRSEIVELLESKGVEFRLYNDAFQYSPKANTRNHRKLLIVDGEMAIVGGRNLSDEYYGLGGRYNFIDKDLWVKGPVVREVQASFDDFWNSGLTSRLARGIEWYLSKAKASAERRARREAAAACLRLRPEDEELLEAGAEQKNQMAVRMPKIQCRDVKFVTDKPHDRTNAKIMGNVISRFFSGTEKHLLIENYTLFAEQSVREALVSLQKRGIPTELLTNDRYVDEIPNRLHLLAHTRIEELAHPTFHPFVYRGEPPLSLTWRPINKTPWIVHSKAAVRDGKDTLIGSYNIDPRSRHTNTEASFIVENCPELADQMTNEVRTIMAGASDMRNQQYRDDAAIERLMAPMFLRALDGVAAKALADFY